MVLSLGDYVSKRNDRPKYSKMKKCLIMFVFLLLSLFTAMVFGGTNEDSMDNNEQLNTVASYHENSQISPE
jgi:hypothetical protein